MIISEPAWLPTVSSQRPSSPIKLGTVVHAKCLTVCPNKDDIMPLPPTAASLLVPALASWLLVSVLGPSACNKLDNMASAKNSMERRNEDDVKLLLLPAAVLMLAPIQVCLPQAKPNPSTNDMMTGVANNRHRSVNCL